MVLWSVSRFWSRGGSFCYKPNSSYQSEFDFKQFVNFKLVNKQGEIQAISLVKKVLRLTYIFWSYEFIRILWALQKSHC